MLRARINVRELLVEKAANASVIYAVGDIHGRLDLLVRMENAISEDAATHAHERAVICYLGDFIDRGPQSAGVIDALCRSANKDIERIFLMGNHEDRLLGFLEDPLKHGPGWMTYGGRETMRSYGLTVPGASEEIDWSALRNALSAALPLSHRRFLADLDIGLFWHDFLFVHAGLNPDASLSAQSPHDLMWIREAFLSCEQDWGLTVVHGHDIVDAPQVRKNRIAVDTGAYKTGTLSSVIIGEERVRILQVQ